MLAVQETEKKKDKKIQPFDKARKCDTALLRSIQEKWQAWNSKYYYLYNTN